MSFLEFDAFYFIFWSPTLRALIAFLSVCVLLPSANADTVLYDSNGFESPSFTVGSSPVGQDGWQDFGGDPAAYRVISGNAASGSQSIQGFGGGADGVSYVAPIIGYAPASDEQIKIEVDIARTLTTANIAESSPVYAVDIYDQNVDRISRFGLQNNNGVIQAFISVASSSDPFVQPLFVGQAINSGTFVHFDFLMNFAAQTVSLALDGTTVAEGIQFLTDDSFALAAAPLQVGTFADSNDVGYFDNYRISAVPEPMSMSALAIGLGGILIRKRMKSYNVSKPLEIIV